MSAARSMSSRALMTTWSSVATGNVIEKPLSPSSVVHLGTPGASGFLLLCRLCPGGGNHFQNRGYCENGSPRVWTPAGITSAGLHFAALSLAGHWALPKYEQESRT